MDSIIRTLIQTKELLYLISATPSYRIIAFFMFGALVGSFLNVVIYRLPKMMKEASLIESHEYFPNVVTEKTITTNCRGTNLGGFSVAPCCNAKIKAYHNIPILSWTVLRGTCAYCSKRISSQYVMVELLTATLFSAIAYLTVGQSAAIALPIALLFATLITISFIDAKEKAIPDELNVIALLLSLASADQATTNHSVTLAISAAFFIFATLSLINELLYKLHGRYVLGGGDVKLTAAIAALVGVSYSLIILSISILLLAIISKTNRKTGYQSLGQYISSNTIIFYLLNI